MCETPLVKKVAGYYYYHKFSFVIFNIVPSKPDSKIARDEEGIIEKTKNLSLSQCQPTFIPWVDIQFSATTLPSSGMVSFGLFGNIDGQLRAKLNCVCILKVMSVT